MKISRRHFLLGLALSGCQVEPGGKTWELFDHAEGLWQALLERPGARAKTYTLADVSATFPVRSLQLAENYADGLHDWELVVEGLVAEPRRYTMAAFQQAFPKVAEVTRHDCVEGWSAIAQWGGARLADLVAAMQPRPEARYVVFESADFDGDTGAPYYGSLPLEQARHPQTLLAYEMNGRPLPVEHGAPLRLKVPTQLGYKSTKFIQKIVFTADLKGHGEGKGGYWEDAGYEHYAGI